MAPVPDEDGKVASSLLYTGPKDASSSGDVTVAEDNTDAERGTLDVKKESTPTIGKGTKPSIDGSKDDDDTAVALSVDNEAKENPDIVAESKKEREGRVVVSPASPATNKTSLAEDVPRVRKGDTQSKKALQERITRSKRSRINNDGKTRSGAPKGTRKGARRQGESDTRSSPNSDDTRERTTSSTGKDCSKDDPASRTTKSTGSGKAKPSCTAKGKGQSSSASLSKAKNATISDARRPPAALRKSRAQRAREEFAVMYLLENSVYGKPVGIPGQWSPNKSPNSKGKTTPSPKKSKAKRLPVRSEAEKRQAVLENRKRLQEEELARISNILEREAAEPVYMRPMSASPWARPATIARRPRTALTPERPGHPRRYADVDDDLESRSPATRPQTAGGEGIRNRQNRGALVHRPSTAGEPMRQVESGTQNTSDTDLPIEAPRPQTAAQSTRKGAQSYNAHDDIVSEYTDTKDSVRPKTAPLSRGQRGQGGTRPSTAVGKLGRPSTAVRRQRAFTELRETIWAQTYGLQTVPSPVIANKKRIKSLASPEKPSTNNIASINSHSPSQNGGGRRSQLSSGKKRPVRAPAPADRPPVSLQDDNDDNNNDNDDDDDDDTDRSGKVKSKGSGDPQEASEIVYPGPVIDAQVPAQPDHVYEPSGALRPVLPSGNDGG